MISSNTVRTMVRKGCEAYLAYVIDTKRVESSLLDIPIVCDYLDVFPKELPRLPPHREIVRNRCCSRCHSAIHYTVSNGSGGVKRIEASVARIVREMIYSSECITMESSSALC